jgi:hypothetical protein
VGTHGVEVGRLKKKKENEDGEKENKSRKGE